MLSRVPKCKQAVMCLEKKMHVLKKHYSGMNYGEVGHEFNVNESTTYRIKHV